MNYAHRKGIDLRSDETGGARVVQGDIVVPIFDLNNGNQIAEQHISGDGRKRFSGAHSGHIAGTFVGPETIRLYICEGWADAVTIHRLTGHQTLWALNNKNVPKVAEWALEHAPDRRIVIAPDYDAAGIKSLLNSKALEKAVVLHPPIIGEDWWDLAQRDEDLCRTVLLQLNPCCIARAAVATGIKPAPLSTMEILSLDEMLARLVFITSGSQVLDRKHPQAIFSKVDYRNALLASKQAVTVGEQVKQVNVFDLWMKHADRANLGTVTFRAGAPEETDDPDGKWSYNTWRAIQRNNPPAGWQEVAKPFFSHIRWLFGADADAFCDWLAHIEQKPGTLPHFGWLHIAANHGLGRNWLASVLHRIWPGYVASNFNLSATLNSGFNGALSRKLLATVDEVDEGNSNKAYQHAQSLKQLVSEETRLINPKFGVQSKEWNCCRWLVFSNKLSALPLEDGDRRFWVVNSDEAPKSAEYYRDLYTKVDDTDFIAAVAHSLQIRDIGTFNPGQRPPLNAAKQAVLARTRTELENILATIRESWPVDLVTSLELREIAGEEEWPKPAALRHMTDRANFVRLYYDFEYDIYGYRRKYGVYCIRNHDQWSAEGVTRPALKKELSRKNKQEKWSSVHKYSGGESHI